MNRETRLLLEDFQQHFVRTHMKGDASAVFNELRQLAEQSGRPYADLLGDWIKCNRPQQDAFRDDNWYVREIPLVRCYFAHTDFRLHAIPKDQRFVDFMSGQRQKIDSGAFPCSSEIRAPWSGPNLRFRCSTAHERKDCCAAGHFCRSDCERPPPQVRAESLTTCNKRFPVPRGSETSRCKYVIDGTCTPE